jgi:competence protein ComEA
MKALKTRRVILFVLACVLALALGAWGLWGHGDQQPSPVAVLGPIVTRGPAGAPATSGEGGSSLSLADPSTTSTSTTVPPSIFVQVAGEVVRPGVYEVPAGSRVFQVLLEAGGATEAADRDAVPLAAVLVDGARVVVPKKGEAGATTVTMPVLEAPSLGPAAGGTAQGATPTPLARVSLNSATAAQLDALPGVGPAIAGRIVAYREAHGGFKSIDELEQVPGIGPATMQRLRDLVSL